MSVFTGYKLSLSEAYELVNKFRRDYNMMPHIQFHVMVMSDPDIRCKKCIDVIHWGGCPSCGSTFISRDILRQTS